MAALVSEVFRFVQLRSTNFNPSNDSNSSGGGGIKPTDPVKFRYSDYSGIDQNELTNSAYKAMKNIKEDDSSNKRQQFEEVSGNYKLEYGGLWDILSEEESSLITFMNWLDSGYTPITKTVFSDKLEDLTSKSIADWETEFQTVGFKTHEFRAWNLFFAEIVNVENEYNLFQLSQLLKAIQVIKIVSSLENLPNDPESQEEIFKPVIEVPSAIFPIPSKEATVQNESEVQSEDTSIVLDDDTCEKLTFHGPKILELVEKFVSFIRSSQAEKQKLAMADFTYEYDENGIPTNADEAPKINQETIDINLIIEYLPKFPLLYLEVIDCKSFVGNLIARGVWNSQGQSEENEEFSLETSMNNMLNSLQEILQNQSYFTFPATYEYLEQQLSVIRYEFSKKIATHLKHKEDVYIQVGTLVIKQSKDKIIKSNRENVSETDPNQPQLLIQGDWNRNTMLWDLADDEALNAMIKVGDFMRVEQSVSCYEASEIAHIENIMIGETRSKTTRRLEREEKTTEKEEIVEKEEERDLQTTERFEMSREAERVQSRDINFDVSLSASGKIGPMQITASSGFGFNQSTQQTQRSAQQYAQSVVERARNRTFSKVRNYEKLTLLREFEDTNLHSFKNEQTDLNINPQNNVGIYRWVDKVYKNKLINYGRRLMIEMYIPDPSAMHRFLTQNQPVGKLTKPQSPAEFGINSANDLTINNFLTYCSYYGVEGVEWEFFKYKSAVIVFNSKDKEGVQYPYPNAKIDHILPIQYEKQGDTKILIIDDGYHSEWVKISVDVDGVSTYGNASCRVSNFDPFTKSASSTWGQPFFSNKRIDGRSANNDSLLCCLCLHRHSCHQMSHD